ncbi:MAG: acetyl-CoA carboxylase biotin carboxyl carrier protein [Candidatus Omnitrophica bacterium]|nr:acetyl-CoA carboxylase biotin carboxyl carrier protein [Candidatus Omnitrophota bacterium]MDE2222657.1 acetyl-CoA carboxylase biotin carboxyl carrier protein [Candidatus Omnitrophota bacterium]
MNLKEIKEILCLMNENNLNEIEIERDGLKLKLKKSMGQEMVVRAAGPETHYAVESIPAPKAAAAAAAPQTAAEPKNGKGEIKSPMVGTFYRSPSPEAEPFVEVGQTVEVGQVVCIVEAMKLMNEIKSEIRGKITEVAVQNGEPVEFGQALFIVDPL